MLFRFINYFFLFALIFINYYWSTKNICKILLLNIVKLKMENNNDENNITNNTNNIKIPDDIYTEIAFKINESPPPIKEKEVQYLSYIKDHKNNVLKAWLNMLKNTELISYIKSLNNNIINLMNTNIPLHDNSKLSQEEWDGYRKFFYPIDKEEKSSNYYSFHEAWNHHKKNNKHHWEYWNENDDINNMTLEHVVEMCCDWIAMGMHFNNTALEFYEKNKSKIKLGSKQLKLTIDILSFYYEK